MATQDLICIKSITSPFPSPAVILSVQPSLERTENKDTREETRTGTEQWKEEDSVVCFRISLSPYAVLITD